MSNSSITLRLEGESPIDEFAKSMTSLAQLLDAMRAEIAGATSITWLVDDLSIGSAIATLRPLTDSPEQADRVAQGVLAVGRALSDHAPIPYGPAVQRAASGLSSVLNGYVTSLTLTVGNHSASVKSRVQVMEPLSVSSFGSIRGSIETLRARRGLKFTLFDELYDGPVECTISDEQRDVIRELWGRRVIVAGTVLRDRNSGRPTRIDPVTSIEPIPDVDENAFLNAPGVLSEIDPSLESHVLVRRIRDAG